MRINKWKEFQVGELFELERGREASPKRVEDGNIPMINEINESNGIAKHGNSKDVFKGNAITISVNYASNVFYQPDNFIASVNILIIRNEHLNKYNGMFITGVLREKHKNYNYINKISKDRLENESILLPATLSGEPDWGYMENYMREMEAKAKERLLKLEELRRQEKRKIDVSGWGEFKVGELFVATRGKSRRMQTLEEGDIPLIAAARSNRGIAGTYNIDAECENCITVSCNGVGCGSTFYHNYPFSITGDAIVLKEKLYMSDYTKQFIASIIDVSFSNKYSYEEKCSADKALNETILLPATPSGEPDWECMESYMREMEEKVKEKLDKLKLEFS